MNVTSSQNSEAAPTANYQLAAYLAILFIVTSSIIKFWGDETLIFWGTLYVTYNRFSLRWDKKFVFHIPW